MKSKFTKIAIMLVSLSLIGCASTTPTVMTDYPELVPASTAVYEWDHSISEALNVAQMVQPAGVGHGMRDYAKGEFAKDGRESGLSRTLGAGVMFLSQGIYGAVADTAMSNRAEQNMNWRSSLVTFIPVDELDNAEKPFRHLQLYFSKKFQEAVMTAYPGLNWLGVFTPNQQNRFDAFNTNLVFFEADACEAAIRVSSVNKEKAVKSFGPRNPALSIEDDVVSQENCSYNGSVRVAGKIVIGNILNYIVVMESFNGQYFDKYLAEQFDGYVIMPQQFAFRALDVPTNIYVKRDFPVVFKQGKALLFETP